MTVYTGDGKVLIAWDMGCGPTWAYDPLGKPIKEKFLGTCEVWRSADGGAAVSLGETSAEAFLDDQIDNCKAVTYWIMENVRGGGQRQIGPVIDVAVPPPRLEPDTTPPSPPNELRCRRKAGGNELSWLASVDDESGVLAYFVYSANDHQPDAVLWVNEEDPLGRPAYGEGEDPTEEEAALGETDPVWERDENGDPIIDEWGNRKAREHARITWLDRTTDGKKPYILGAIDNALNLSDPTGRVDPDSGLPEPSVWPAGTVPASYVGKVKERWPVEPVTPEGAPFLWVDAFGPWTEHGGIRLRGLITLDKMEWDDEWVYGENRCTDLDLWNDEDAWPMWHIRDDTVPDWHYPNNQLSLLPAFIFYDGDEGRYRLKVKWERYRYGYGVYYWARSITSFDFNVMPNAERTLTIVSSADGGLDALGNRLVSIVTTADHDLYVGNTIVIDGHESTPDINGWLDEDDVQQGAHIVSEVHSYPGWYWTSPPNLPPNLRRFEITLPDGDPFTGGAGGTVTVPYVPDGGKIYLGNLSNHQGDGFWMLPRRGPVSYDDHSHDEW